MGRAKLNLELIPKKEARIVAFNKRKQSLKKKLHELKTLCGVDACMIIYGPDQEHSVAEVYPSDDLHGAFQIIDNYRSKKDDPTKCKRFGLPDFWEERAKKAEEELAKLRKQNMKAKYPMIDEEKDPFVLREFANQLLAKSRDVKSRIEYLKRMNQFPIPQPESFSDLLMGNLDDNNGPVNVIDENESGGADSFDEGIEYLLLGF